MNAENLPEIVIIDDDKAIMRCVGTCLQRQNHASIIGYAAHAQAGVALALEVSPDVVILDIHMPGYDAFAACREIIEKSSEKVHVLFYTGFPRDDYLDRAIAAGASGMVSKHTESLENLGLAIRYILKGESYFSPELAKRLRELESRAPHSLLSTLTHRELRVIRALAKGKINKEIAAEIDISLRLVEKEIADLKLKLHFRSTNELLVFAANEGLIFSELAGIR